MLVRVDAGLVFWKPTFVTFLSPPLPPLPPPPGPFIPVVISQDFGPDWSSIQPGNPVSLVDVQGVGNVQVLSDGTGSRALRFAMIADNVRQTVWTGDQKFVAIESWLSSLSISVQRLIGPMGPQFGPVVNVRGVNFVPPLM